MVHIAIFEDDSFYHKGAVRILSEVFKTKSPKIKIYKHWTEFEQQSSDEVTQLDYVFLDDDLGRDSNGRFVHGEKVRKNLELLGHHPKFIGISRTSRSYVNLNIGKFPGESSEGWKVFDSIHLSKEKIIAFKEKLNELV